MSERRTAVAVFAPWAGLVVGVAALAFAHQFGADGMFDDCAAFDPAPILIVGVIAIVATVIAGLLSWRAFKANGTGDAGRVISVLSVGTAALFCLAMIYPILATLIIPPCFM